VRDARAGWVETKCSGLRKSCSLRVTSETCGRCRGDLNGQKSLVDKGESQDEMQASWVVLEDLDRRARCVWWRSAGTDMGAGGPPCRWIAMHEWCMALASSSSRGRLTLQSMRRIDLGG
jgi:hypothetical protein